MTRKKTNDDGRLFVYFFIFQIFLPATADSSGVRTVSASPPGGGATDTRLVDTCTVV